MARLETGVGDDFVGQFGQFGQVICSRRAIFGRASSRDRASNLARISFVTDNVFSDRVSLQMTSVTGNPAQG